jgi:hypothetical protein
MTADDDPVAVAGWMEAVVIAGPLLPQYRDHLRRAVALAYGSPGQPAPPQPLLDLLRIVSRGAERASAHRQERMQVTVASGHAAVRAAAAPEALGAEPETVSTKDAAAIARLSERHMRRVAREHAIEAWTDHHGAWRFEIDSLAAWVAARHRKETMRKAA